MYLSIIIPLFNEEESITVLLPQLLQLKLPEFVTQFEIVVVDDYSTDNSLAEAKKFEADNVLCIESLENNGKGAAVRKGISQAKGDIFLIQDADLELSPSDIPSMLQAMHSLNVPFVNGSRYLPGVLRTQAAFKRYMANKLFTLLTSLFVDVHLTDMACGYKLFTKDLYNKLELKENRFGFEAELIIKCGRLRRNWIAEVPVSYSPRNEGEGKKLKNIDGLRIFNTIIKYGLLRRK